MPVALDATYSIGRELSGVGVYCRELLFGLCRQQANERFLFCYRPHRFFRSFQDSIPPNAARFLLHDRFRVPNGAGLFHGLNQRMPGVRLKRTVCTFHDLFVMTAQYSTGEYRQRFTKLARDAAERADLIITVSQYTADQVHDLLGVEQSRLRVVHHGVRVPHNSGSRRERLILHVGAIQIRKNVARLVRAFGAVEPGWQLVLAGSMGHGSEETMQAIAESRSQDRIKVTGYVDNSQLAALYRRASVFAFPSLDEGFGMPVLEAMANGVPVLASNRSALPEVCGDAAMLVNPEEQEDIERGLVQLTGDNQMRDAYAAKGLQRAAAFTWDKAVKRTWNVYSELRGRT